MREVSGIVKENGAVSPKKAVFRYLNSTHQYLWGRSLL